MTALDDLYADVAPIRTAEDWREAWANPETRWYARRKLPALVAAGIVSAVSFDVLHPRGRDGKFIEKFGIVRWFGDDMIWHQGIVRSVGVDQVKGTPLIQVMDGHGDNHIFTNPKELQARPRPKARMNLPPVTTAAPAGSGFTKYKGQGGSNPGGFYEITDVTQAVPNNLGGQPMSPDISSGHEIQKALRFIAAPGTSVKYNVPKSDPVAQVSADMGDTIIVPRVDGTPNRYDVFARMNSKWYRVPATGSMFDANLAARADLLVPAETIFGTPDSPRRQALMNDPGYGVISLNRKPDASADTLAQTVQQAASPPPLQGDKFYIKQYQDPGRARNEALANDFYELAGVAVPEVTVGEDGKTVSSKLIGESVPFDPTNPDHVKEARAGFVMDAWLANWDAVGMSYDNMQVTSDGTVFRVDAGGALLYRAMEKSGPKGAMFGNDVGELKSLTNPSINPQAAAVYGGITKAELDKQAEMLRAISPAQISELAQSWDLPQVGPILIARRKSILDQINPPESPLLTQDAGNPLFPGMTQAEIHAKLTTPATVYNPTEEATQPGQPPKNAVSNFQVAINDLPKATLTADDLADQELMSGVILVHGGELWVPTGGYTDKGGFVDQRYRNLVTGEQASISAWPGDQIASTYTTTDPALEDLADKLRVQYDLAVAEVVADSAQFDSITAMNNDQGWKEQYPYFLQPQDAAVAHLDFIDQWMQDGRLPQDGPLYNSTNGKVYEIVGLTTTPLGNRVIELRESGGDNTVKYDNSSFQTAGWWQMPTNPASVAVYKSRLTPATTEPVSTVPLKAKIQDAKPSGDWGGNLDTTSPYTDPSTQFTGDPLSVLDDKLEAALKNWTNQPDKSQAEKDAAVAEYVAAVNAINSGHGDSPAATNTPTLDKLSATPPLPAQPDTAVVVNPPQSQHVENVNAAADAAEPTVSKTIDPDTGLLTSLGPGTPIHTKDPNNKPKAEDWQWLEGKNIVLLPQTNFDNPDDTSNTLNDDSGLMTVTAVHQYYGGNVWVSTVKGNNDTTGFYINQKSAYGIPSVVTPVETAPIPAMHVTMKQNGDLLLNGKQKIGKWFEPYQAGAPKQSAWYHQAIIDADWSITGKPVAVYGNKNQVRSAVLGMTIPTAPPPKKPKKSAATITEAEIMHLKEAYTVKFTPEVTQQVTAQQSTTVTHPAGQQPLADGTQPKVGQWVYAPKDNTWWQVQQTDPKLTGKQPGTNIRVRRKVTQPDGSVKTVESFRGRSTMYAVSGELAYPTQYLPTNVVTIMNGKKAGPGMEVWSDTVGAGGRIAEIKGGKIKVRNPLGENFWVEASTVEFAGSPNTPSAKIAQTESTAEAAAAIQAQIEQTVSEMVAKQVAQDLAAAGIKKIKKGPVTYPGPGGTLVKQGPQWAEIRSKKGLQNLADGYSPAIGMVLRHKDGSRWIVIGIGAESNPNQQNKVKVIPQGADQYANGTWRAMSMMVVDHEAMLTDKDGKALPRIKTVASTSDADYTALIPDGALLYQTISKQYVGYDKKTGVTRYKNVAHYYAIQSDPGTNYTTAIELASGNKMWQWQGILTGGTRVGVIDKTGGDQNLTMTIDTTGGPSHGYGNEITAFTIHNPDTDPTALAAGSVVPAAKTPPAQPVTTPQPAALKIGDQVMVSTATAGVQQGTVTAISPDSVTVLWGSNTITVPLSFAVPVPAGGDTFMLPDGNMAVVGQQVTWGGGTGPTDQYILIGAVPGGDMVQIQATDGQVLTVPYSSLTGISPPNPNLPKPTVTTMHMMDGTTINVGDTITVNGTQAVVTNVVGTPTAPILKIDILPGHYPGTADPSKDKIASVGSKPATPAAPPAAAPTAPPPPPLPPVISPTGVNLTGPLPEFGGTNEQKGQPVGPELPHPPSVTSSPGSVQAPKISGTGADLTTEPPSLAGMAGVFSPMEAFDKANARIEHNKQTGHASWPVTYGMGDSDLVEDMMFHTQVVRQGGKNRTETTFRLTRDQALALRAKLYTKGSTTTTGDWASDPVDPMNLVVGDQISVKVSSQNQNVLKPNAEGQPVPNGVITAGPVLIGKSQNPAFAQYNVYRVEVAFQNGQSGVLELLSGYKPFYRYTWDPQKTKTTNGSTQLNPDAANDGWGVAYTSLNYPKGDGKVTLNADGTKTAPTTNQYVDGNGQVLTRNIGGTTDITYWTTSDTRNTLDGQVQITIDADDPDAQRRLSEALEAVGIPPERQGPPSKDQLTQMALNKVYKQFAPTYVPGERPTGTTPTNPSQILGMIDKELGPQLGRPATLHDISLQVDPEDGRVQVLLSPDIAQAVMDRNGSTSYGHEFIRGGADAMFSVLSGESPGLLSTNERWNSGLFYIGYSSTADHAYDSANRVYFRANKKNYIGGSSWGIAVSAPTMHRHIDLYWRDSDSMGARDKNVDADNRWLDLPLSGGNQELMVKRSFEQNLFAGVIAPGEHEKQLMIDRLKKWGLPKAPNGQEWEDFIQVGTIKVKDMQPANFGPEIPLDQLVAPAVPA